MVARPVAPIFKSNNCYMPFTITDFGKDLLTFWYKGNKLTFKKDKDAICSMGWLNYQDHYLANIDKVNKSGIHYLNYHPLGHKITGWIKFADMLTQEEQKVKDDEREQVLNRLKLMR